MTIIGIFVRLLFLIAVFNLSLIYILDKESKLQKIINYLTSIILICFIIVPYISVAYVPKTVVFATEKMSKMSSCEGIDLFYTNTSFKNDYYIIADLYKNRYGAEDNNDFLEFLPPEALLDENIFSYDCEDFAHSVRCLGELYNITCSFYGVVETSYNKEVDELLAHHLGVYCEICYGKNKQDCYWEKFS